MLYLYLEKLGFVSVNWGVYSKFAESKITVFAQSKNWGRKELVI
ncbi:hypothetical protein SACC_04660 [Saccharolobus caldissimus]|uniref:Uncharacterized protein n=1 Tax=Saccharolobus caldissimus TaxID=1702097 RepID=A0AAQ4CNR8_9CREN|nr:hypothetical protein SACC_04660 [Saccharolobus caldissimus]